MYLCSIIRTLTQMLAQQTAHKPSSCTAGDASLQNTQSCKINTQLEVRLKNSLSNYLENRDKKSKQLQQEY